MSSYKTIKVSEQTYHNLARMGTLEDSFDSVIDRLLKPRNMQEVA